MHLLASISGNCPKCEMHIYSSVCTRVSLSVFGICDKGICSIFPSLTVGVLWDGGRGEKVWLRLIGKEICKEVERRNNEREREKRGWKRGLREKEKQRNVWKDQGRHVSEQIENANFTLAPTSSAQPQPLIPCVNEWCPQNNTQSPLSIHLALTISPSPLPLYDPLSTPFSPPPFSFFFFLQSFHSFAPCTALIPAQSICVFPTNQPSKHFPVSLPSLVTFLPFCCCTFSALFGFVFFVPSSGWIPDDCTALSLAFLSCLSVLGFLVQWAWRRTVPVKACRISKFLLSSLLSFNSTLYIFSAS